MQAQPIIDAEIHAPGLSDQDLKDLVYFGVEAAVSVERAKAAFAATGIDPRT